MAKNTDLAKLFGVEGMITKKTLTNETKKDVMGKTPNEMTLDIRALLDEMNSRVISHDIIGVIECLTAVDLRVACMKIVAEEIRKSLGK